VFELQAGDAGNSWRLPPPSNKGRVASPSVLWVPLSPLLFVSASSPLVGFGELNDNAIKDLTVCKVLNMKLSLLHNLWIVK
jgi:hypothetical protein